MTTEFEAAEAAGALDLLLSDAALGAARRFRPDTATLRLAVRLARRPQMVTRRARRLAAELGKIATGNSAIAAPPRDRRFADPAWHDNPLLRRAVQAYLAAGQTADALLAEADLDWRDNERLTFLLGNLIAAAAPSNNPIISPVAWKALIDTGGLSAIRGIRALLSDLAAPPRIPTMVAPDAFEVGRDLAVTPGAVVSRTEVYELIQYKPATDTVHRFPLLIVPPMINKFYLTDLAPGRSMIEFLVGQGHQVFVISWRNPDARHRHWGLDTYGGAVADALAAVRHIGKAPRASMCALCSSGIVSSMVSAHLNATGHSDQLASLCLGVTVLDQARAGTAGAMIDESTAQAAILTSASRGYLDGRALAEVFAWLRPDRPDLELLGQQLPAGPDPTAVRHPVLERRHHAAACGAAPRFHRAGPVQRAHQAGSGHHARFPGRSLQGRHRQLRRSGHRRPYLPVAIVLPQHPAARRHRPVRAVHEWAHRFHGQPAVQPQSDLPDRARHSGGAQ